MKILGQFWMDINRAASFRQPRTLGRWFWSAGRRGPRCARCAQGLQSRGADRRQSDRRDSSLRTALRDLPWYGGGGRVADRPGRISGAAATGRERSGGRSAGMDILEDRERNPLDGHAGLESHLERPADVDACLVPEAHAEAPSRGPTGLAAGPELTPGSGFKCSSSYLEQPAWGQLWVANELAKRGLSIPPRGCAASGSATTSP